jgi:hypothetical protein
MSWDDYEFEPFQESDDVRPGPADDPAVQELEPQLLALLTLNQKESSLKHNLPSISSSAFFIG